MQTPDPDRPGHPDARRLVRAVRAASGPAAAADAARRIADGAWERAGMSPATRTQARRMRPLRSTVLRRWGLAAAAAVLAAVGVFAVRPTEPAFAVDGDPVQVWRQDRWEEETRSVAPGATLYVADGNRVLRGPRGAEIVPSPGTTLRIVRGDTRTGFRVEILTGAAEVAGDTVRLSLGDLDVEPGLRGMYRAFAALPAAVHDHQPATPPSSTAIAMASVRIELGDAVLTRRSTGERMDLRGGRAIALVPEAGSGDGFRLCRVDEFGPETELRIAAGHPVVKFLSFGGEGMALLGGPEGRLSPVAVREAKLGEAIEAMNRAMHVFVTRLGENGTAGGPFGTANINVAISTSPDGFTSEPLEMRAFRSGARVSELTSVVNGRRVRVIVEDGAVTVESDGSTRTYADVAAARAAEPETLAPLLEHLGD